MAGAGRKKTAVKDKAAAGNPGGRPLEVLDIPEMEGVEMPYEKRVPDPSWNRGRALFTV